MKSGPMAEISQGQKAHGYHRQNLEGDVEPPGSKKRTTTPLGGWERRDLTFPATEAS